MAIPDFAPVAQAIAALEASEKALETLAATNDSAAANLITVQQNADTAVKTAQDQANSAAANFAGGQADAYAKAEAVKAAIAEYESGLPAPPPPPPPPPPAAGGE